MTNLCEPFLSVETFNCSADYQLKERAVTKANRNFTVLCIQKGRGAIVIDKVVYQLSDGSLFCLPAATSNYFHPDSKVQGYTISFDEVFLNLLNQDASEKNYASVFSHLSDCKSIQLDDDIFTYLFQIFTKMDYEFRHPGRSRFVLLTLYLKLFLIYLERSVCPVTSGTPTNIHNKLTADFLSAVQKNFRKIKKVTEYADKLSVSSNHLNEVVKKHTGYSAHYHIQQRIILEAKCKAVNSDVHMKEIAYQLGFESTSHFSKYFRNVSGINFTVFKRNYALSM